MVDIFQRPHTAGCIFLDTYLDIVKLIFLIPTITNN